MAALHRRNGAKLPESANMSFNHATNRFYPFVKVAQSAENQPS
jgi:hypothetical protein